MRLIYRGAEADIYSGRWSSERAIYKFRKPLPYRHPQLDAEIRGQRTFREAEIIDDARRLGVRVPRLFYVSRPESLIVMQEIAGRRLKAVLSSGGGRSERLSSDFGAAVGKLHAGGVMHGDLTTSNVLVDASGISLIDFGLSAHSERVEDHAVDLRLIKETLVGAHYEVAQAVLSSFMSGYAGEVGPARARTVGRKLVEIERRGRYARVE